MSQKSVLASFLTLLTGLSLAGCQQQPAKPDNQRPQGVPLSQNQVTAPIPPDASPEQRKMQEYANQQAQAALERAKAGR